MKTKTIKKPVKNKTEPAPSQNKNRSNDINTIVTESRAPMLSDEILLDFGKTLINSSITQSIEFHKTMLGLTATFVTLMASSFGIVAFRLENYQLDGFQKTLLVIPIFLMLVSSVCFALGYYPRFIEVRLQILDSIKEARNKLIRIRRVWAFVGVTFFILSIFALVVGIIFF
jgi:uncharacterized membrane protein YidH (DUF202 family)